MTTREEKKKNTRDLSSEKIQSEYRLSCFSPLLVTLSDRIICQKQLNFNRKQNNMSIFDPVKQLPLISIMSSKVMSCIDLIYSEKKRKKCLFEDI